MVFRDVHVEEIPGGEGLVAVFARVGESSWHVDILYMLPKVAPILGGLATEGAPVQPRTVLHYVVIKELVPTTACKQQSIKVEDRFICSGSL